MMRHRKAVIEGALMGILSLLFWSYAGAQQSSAGIVDSWLLNQSGTMSNPTTDTGVTIEPTFWVDFSQDPSGATITSNTGQVLTKHGAPSRISDGTWPLGLGAAQGFAEKLDGVVDYWTSDIPPPAGSFSVACVVTPATVAAGGKPIIGNWTTTGNKRGWELEQYDTRFFFSMSDDGTGGAHQIDVNITAGAVGRRTFLAATYNAATNGMVLYADGVTPAAGTANGPTYSGADYLYIGMHTGVGFFPGTIHDCRIFGRVLSAADAAQLRAQWLGIASSGGNALSLTSASPPAVMVAAPGSGTEPFLVSMPANTTTIGSPAAGAGGIPESTAVDNLAQRAVYEAWAGAAGGCSASVSGWGAVCTAGDGTADLTSATSRAEGQTAGKIVLTGTTSTVMLYAQNCNTGGIGADLYGSIWAKKDVTSTTDFSFYLLEYDAADCSGAALASKALGPSNANLTTTWTRYSVKVLAAAWNAATSSYNLRIYEVGDGVTSYFDAAYVGATDPGDSYCGCDTDATCSCTAVYPTRANISRSINSAFTIQATVRPVVAVASERMLRLQSGSSGMDFETDATPGRFLSYYDAAGGVDYINAGGAYTLNTDVTLRGVYGGSADTGYLKIGSTYYRTITDGGGTGLLAGQLPTLTLGTAGMTWIREITLFGRGLE
jgi:hypothetical protein